MNFIIAVQKKDQISGCVLQSLISGSRNALVSNGIKSVTVIFSHLRLPQCRSTVRGAVVHQNDFIIPVGLILKRAKTVRELFFCDCKQE